MSSPVYLPTVSAIGTYADLPAFGIQGRKYFATDTNQEWYDTGTAWVLASASKPVAILSAAPSAAGPFSIAHGLAFAPSRISILMTNAGSIWQQSVPDGTNVNLNASDAGITATIYVFA